MSLRWKGWRGSCFVLREKDLYIADATLVAQHFRYRQIGPVQLLRRPIPE